MMYEHDIFFIHSRVDGLFGCFHFLSITDSLAINVEVLLFLQHHVKMYRNRFENILCQGQPGWLNRESSENYIEGCSMVEDSEGRGSIWRGTEEVL